MVFGYFFLAQTDTNPPNAQWRWTSECAGAFKQVKEVLVSSQMLANYDPKLYPEGSERPIAFTSRKLSKSERNYAQLEKEALSLVYGVQHFHRYLYGRCFTLVTDHKLLTTILSPCKGTPSLAAARLQRWAIILSAYWYQIEYKCTKDHRNADGLSRMPIPTMEAQETPAVDVAIKAMAKSACRFCWTL